MRASEVLKRVKAQLSQAVTTAKGQITDLRGEIGRLRKELAHAQRLPLPLSDIEPRIAESVRQAGARWLAEHGEILVRSEGGIGTYQAKCGGRLPFTAAEAIPFGALCAGAPDQVIELLSAIYQQVPYEAGPPAAERPALIERLKRELAEAEQVEEAAVDEAAAAGVVIAHRPEVVARRRAEAAAREREEREVADRARRQEALDTEHDTRLRARFRHPEPPAGL